MARFITLSTSIVMDSTNPEKGTGNDCLVDIIK